MYILYCDICEMPIKETEKVYVLSIREALQNPEEMKDQDDIYDCLKKSMDSSDKREICSKCKKIFEKFVSLRVKEIKKLQKQLNHIEREDEVDGNV